MIFIFSKDGKIIKSMEKDVLNVCNRRVVGLSPMGV